MRTPCAEAIKKEWAGLLREDRPVVDMSDVREWHDVARQANKEGRVIHMGRMFGIMVCKNWEDPALHKMKYRVVFQGDQVKTQNLEVALFQDLGSAPVSMDGANCIIAAGMQKGYVIQQADAEQAYTQAPMTGIETWVMLPTRDMA